MSEALITTVQEPDIQGMPRTYTSQRTCAQETPVPVRGAVLGDPYGIHRANIVLSAQAVPNVKGQMVHTVQHCTHDIPGPGPWMSLHGSSYDDENGISLPYTLTPYATVDGALAGSGSGASECTPVHEALAMVKTTDVEAIAAALQGIHYVMPTQDTVSLPAVVSGVKCVVTRNRSNGNAVGVGSSFSMSNESSMAIAADFIYDIEEGGQFGVDAEIHIFYLPQASVATILAITGSIKWPLYREKSHRVSVRGTPRSQHVTMTSSDGGQSLSEGSQVGAFVTTQMIPASLHTELPIEIVYEDSTARTGSADDIVDNIVAMGVQRVAMLRALVAAGGTVMGMDCSVPANATLVNAYLDNMADQTNLSADLEFENFLVTVEPTTIPATNVTGIQSGRYLKWCSVSPYRYGLFQVQAKVIIVDP
mgnify:CR=1 FL=1